MADFSLCLTTVADFFLSLCRSFLAFYHHFSSFLIIFGFHLIFSSNFFHFHSTFGKIFSILIYLYFAFLICSFLFPFNISLSFALYIPLKSFKFVPHSMHIAWLSLVMLINVSHCNHTLIKTMPAPLQQKKITYFSSYRNSSLSGDSRI